MHARSPPLLAADLIHVLCEWICLVPLLDESRHGVVAETIRAIGYLWPLAKLQDLIFEAIQGAPGEENGASREGDALRRMALNMTLSYLDEMESHWRVSTEPLLDSLSIPDMVSTLARWAVPEDAKTLSLPTRAANVDMFETRAMFLLQGLGLETNETSLAGVLGWEHEGDLLDHVDKPVELRNSLVLFFREVGRHVGGPNRPVGVEKLGWRFISTAFLPSLICQSSRPGRLVDLPHEYTMLMLRFIAKGANCETCGTQPSRPALCLLCGRLLCFQVCFFPPLEMG